MNNLAIIIPAYKSIYLKQTLDSLVKQTNKNFTVYIGDDASPYDLKQIVNGFNDKLNIVYHKFEENLGSVSLPQQWARCVSMSVEKWIWLFSDDDIASETCVESFFRTIEQNRDSRLFKFHTKIIDKENNIIKLHFDLTNNYKSKISAKRFFENRIKNKRFRSYMVEYVFERTLFNKFSFVDFPLAWIADDATWYMYSEENNGIDVIQDYVFWRLSGSNISSDEKSLGVIEQKLDANKQFILWTNKRGIFENYKKYLLNYILSQHYSLFKDIKRSKIYIKENYETYFTIKQINEAVLLFKINFFKNTIIKKIKKVLIGL